MKRTIGPDPQCGLDVPLTIVGGKWKLLVLWHVARGPRRFGELRRLVEGVSEKVLIQQLRELEDDGILTRKDHHEVPPRVDYTITAFGRGLGDALLPLCDWGNANRRRVEARRAESA